MASTPTDVPPSPSPSPPPTPLPSPRKLKQDNPSRKRRRALPTLSVTSVFNPARLPESARALWSWPVTSWYLGDVTDADLKLASDRPFATAETYPSSQPLHPVRPHYRLKWLEEDAHAAAVPNFQVPLPDPLPVFPPARNKDTTACARPSPQLVPVEVSKRAKTDSASKRNSLANAPNCTQPKPFATTDKSFSISSDATTAMGSESKDDFLPGSSLPSPLCKGTPDAYMRPACPSPNLPVKVAPHQIEPPPVNYTLGQSETRTLHQATLSQLDDTLPVAHSPIAQSPQPTPASVNDTPSGDQICLQFVSPHEPRLMASINYSLVKPSTTPRADQSDPLIDAHTDIKEDTAVMQTLVGDLQLNFRSVATDFATTFEDADATDEVGPEIVRICNRLEFTEAAAHASCEVAVAAVTNELGRQLARDRQVDEAQQIMRRLKEIDQEKAAAKKAAQSAALAASRAASAESRRLSKQSGAPEPKQRRRSRTSRRRGNKDEESKVEVVPQQSSGSDMHTSQAAVSKEDQHESKPVLPASPQDAVRFKVVSSPCAIFPRENNVSGDIGRMPSPVSPIQAASRGVTFANVPKAGVAGEATVHGPTWTGVSAEATEMLPTERGGDIDCFGRNGCALEGEGEH